MQLDLAETNFPYPVSPQDPKTTYPVPELSFLPDSVLPVSFYHTRGNQENHFINQNKQ